MSTAAAENNAPVGARQDLRSDSGIVPCYEPASWNDYFNIRDDIELEVGTFRIYRRGVEGPLLFFIHGGGFSALTWAVLSTAITDQIKCQCLAVDMRGHGDTSCQNDEDLSIETLSRDVIKIIFAMYPTEAPPIILVGHSMGGAVAVHVAHKRTVPSLAGLVVIDVVEGSALSSLQGMTAFLRSRPNSFHSLSHAIEWSVRTSQLKNIQSARVSFPGQLKRIKTNQTATSELEQGTAVIFSELDGKHSVPNSTESSKPPVPSRLAGLEEDQEEVNQKTTNHTLPVSASESFHSTTGCPSESETTRSEYTWRIDLTRTKDFWNGWFVGLSQLFLSIPEPKLLLLAGVDRLDKDLTIGQMQGKFQLHVFPNCGHALQEDAPDKVAECLAKFLVRNRLAEARSNCTR